MELRHLRYFVAAAEEENVSRAALKLHVSQPGISRQIRDLEAEIGFQLFERRAKSLKLTAAGRALLADARAVLQHAEDAVKNARAIADEARGEINVGYAPSVTVEIVPRALRKFQQDFPRARVALHDLANEEMLARLHAGQLQVALMVRQEPKKLRGLAVRELARYAICVALAPGHPLAKSKTLTLQQIASEPFIAYSRVDYPEIRLQMAKFFTNAGLKPRFTGEHDGGASVIAAVEAGTGFALVPSCLAVMVGARVKLIPVVPALPAIFVVAIWKPESETELLRKFIAAAGTDAVT